MSGGVSSYKILAPKGYTNNKVMNAAVLELQSLFKAATGYTLQIVTDDQATYTKQTKYISLGGTTYAQDAGFTVSSALDTDGYEIKTKGASVFILGQDYGTLYGVYGLMEDLFDYEYYYKNVYNIEEKQTVYLTDVTEQLVTPDIENRASGYATTWAENDVYNPNRWKEKIYTNYVASVGGQHHHTAFSLLPPDTYKSAHPNWYSSQGDQLCYTAHGDANEYQAMVSAMVEAIKAVIKAKPDMEYIYLAGMDNDNACSCGNKYFNKSGCQKYKSDYGSDSAAYILFAKDVNKQIRAWLSSQTEVNSDMEILLLAYLGYEAAPTKNIADLVCEEGLVVVFAPIEIAYNRPLTDTTKSTIAAWKAVCSRIGFWFYDGVFGTINEKGTVTGRGTSASYVPYYSIDILQSTYQYIVSIGAEYIFWEARSGGYGLRTNWDNLKMYLHSQLAWDSQADVNEMMDGFFANMYGDASKTMLALYNDMNAYMANLSKTVAGYPYGDWAYKKNWDKTELLSWYAYFDTALADIEHLKTTDATLYNKLHKHIVAERIGIGYMLIQFYGGTFSEGDLATYQANLKADIIETGIQEGTTKGEALYNSLMGIS